MICFGVKFCFYCWCYLAAELVNWESSAVVMGMVWLGGKTNDVLISVTLLSSIVVIPPQFLS